MSAAMRSMIGVFMVLLSSGEVASMLKQEAASFPRQHIVEIQAFRFQPQQTVVATGDTIVWINRDFVPHTVTANDGIWESKKLDEGQSWTVVVPKSGIYSYYCQFHPQMTGRLMIRDKNNSKKHEERLPHE